MKKISRKLLLSILSMAFAVVALGTTTFAWFTTNATVTANIKIGVQSTTDSILISKDLVHWGSTTEIDRSKDELGAYTYIAQGSKLANDDVWATLDGSGATAALKNQAIDETTEDILQFDLYLKVSSTGKTIKIDTDSTTGTKADDIGAYTIQKDFSITTPSEASFAANDKVRVSALNALRGVLDVSEPVANSTLEGATTEVGAKTAFGNPGLTRNEKLAGYKLADSITPGVDRTGASVFDFGQTLSTTNAANAYITSVLATDFTKVAPNANYAAITPTTAGFTGTDLFTTTAADQIYRLRFTYWLEGFDGDCFDAVFGQDLSIDLSFTTKADQTGN